MVLNVKIYAYKCLLVSCNCSCAGKQC